MDLNKQQEQHEATESMDSWKVRLAQSMGISFAFVFTPVVLLLLMSAFASVACWAFGGLWCAP